MPLGRRHVCRTPQRKRFTQRLLHVVTVHLDINANAVELNVDFASGQPHDRSIATWRILPVEVFCKQLIQHQSIGLMVQ